MAARNESMLDGTIFISGTRTLYVGPLVAARRHAHHAAQIIIALLSSILSAVGAGQPAEPRHPAARRMCAYLDGQGDVDLASLSQAAGLSPRQMRHAFARDVGLPMRAYLRWKRLRRAIAAVEEGASLSTAAVDAGFADSAHLSRVFREQFGMTPTQGLSAIQWQALG